MAAEESSTQKITVEDLFLALLALLIVGQALQRLPAVLEEHFGISLGLTPLVAGVEVTDDTPTGTPVVTLKETSYETDAGTSETQTFPPGTRLTITDGPRSGPFGYRAFEVRDTERDTSGWVAASSLIVAGIGGLGSTGLGGHVQAIVPTDLWNVPGGVVSQGALRSGVVARLAHGPEYAHGSRWWYVAREADNGGWVTEDVLTGSSEQDWHAGMLVRAQEPMNVYDRAGGGLPVAELGEGEEAHLTGVPDYVDTSYWWQVTTYDETTGWVPERGLALAGTRGWAAGFLGTIVFMGTIVALALLGGIVYATIRTNQIRQKETQRIRDAIPKNIAPKRNDRWDLVMRHVSSENPSEWRLAIIEADIMLDEVVTKIGYTGTTLGEKLKQATRGDMKTLDAAWEAHRVRNQVAHAGSDYILTQREARRVVDLYGMVFDEFKYI